AVELGLDVAAFDADRGRIESESARLVLTGELGGDARRAHGAVEVLGGGVLGERPEREATVGVEQLPAGEDDQGDGGGSDPPPDREPRQRSDPRRSLLPIRRGSGRGGGRVLPRQESTLLVFHTQSGSFSRGVGRTQTIVAPH